jgi:hypothetical protein
MSCFLNTNSTETFTGPLTHQLHDEVLEPWRQSGHGRCETGSGSEKRTSDILDHAVSIRIFPILNATETSSCCQHSYDPVQMSGISGH